jgi:hypothetical protein
MATRRGALTVGNRNLFVTLLFIAVAAEWMRPDHRRENTQ